jgi:hypothetical protein
MSLVNELPSHPNYQIEAISLSPNFCPQGQEGQDDIRIPDPNTWERCFGRQSLRCPRAVLADTADTSQPTLEPTATKTKPIGNASTRRWKILGSDLSGRRPRRLRLAPAGLNLRPIRRLRKRCERNRFLMKFVTLAITSYSTAVTRTHMVASNNFVHKI